MDEETNSDLNGLILAGGLSSRMGCDKSKIVYNNKPQYQTLYDLLKKNCSEVFLSQKKEEQTLPKSLLCIVDQFEIRSPLIGILSAFQYDGSKAWLTVPCDMPLIDQALITFLILHRDKEKVATCFWDSDKKYPEPLFTIWEQKADFLLKAYFKRGNFSPREFLIHQDIKIIDTPDIHKLVNINTPIELTHFLSQPFGINQ